MSEVKATIDALSAPFDPKVIRRKPGSDKRPALPYVSHGLVTKRLNEVCPGWSTRVVEMHTFMDGNGRLQCAGVTLELTVPGVGSRVEFGTAERPQGFGKDAKNAMSDALKRCAMRFGVAIDLWESADEDDEDAQPVIAPVERRPAPARPAPRQEPRPLRPSAPASGEVPFDWTDFWAWAKPRGINDRQALDAAAGEPTSGKTPAEIRRLIEARAATA